MNRCLLPILAAVFGSSAAVAQDSDGCEVPLQLSSHDVAISTVKRAADDYRYENECTSKADAGSSNFGVGYQGATLSAGGSNQSTESFCKGYTAQTGQRDASYQYARAVVREALSAFIACKQLARLDIKARFRISPQAVTIDIGRLSHPATFNGVFVAPADALRCEQSNPKGGEPLVVDHSVKEPLVDGETLVVTCRRTDKDAGDGQLFDAVALTVDTTQGSASVDIPASRYPAPITTDQLLASIKDVDAAARERDVAINTQLVALSSFNERWQKTATSQHQVVARPGDRNREIGVGCPVGEYVTGISQRGFTIGGGAVTGPFEWMTVTCQAVPLWPGSAGH